MDGVLLRRVVGGVRLRDAHVQPLVHESLALMWRRGLLGSQLLYRLTIDMLP